MGSSKGKNRQLGTQLSSQFICVSHPTVCDINRISNLAMNYFCIVKLCSHFPYVASTATNNNSLLIFKILPINTIQIIGHLTVFLGEFTFFSHLNFDISLLYVCIKPLNICYNRRYFEIFSCYHLFCLFYFSTALGDSQDSKPRDLS